MKYKYDTRRTELLCKLEITILRYTNKEVITQTDAVVLDIKKKVAQLVNPPLHPLLWRGQIQIIKILDSGIVLFE